MGSVGLSVCTDLVSDDLGRTPSASLVSECLLVCSCSSRSPCWLHLIACMVKTLPCGCATCQAFAQLFTQIGVMRDICAGHGRCTSRTRSEYLGNWPEKCCFARKNGTNILGMKRELRAGVGAYLKRTPSVKELRVSLARPGETELPRSTQTSWTESGHDRTLDSLMRVANHYHGQRDADGETIDSADMYEYLRIYFGHTTLSEEPAQQ